MTASYFDQTSSRVIPWKRATLLGFALGAQLLIANDAAAQQACGETTCAQGFTCETVSGACPAIDCAEGAECKPCEPQDYHWCAPAACSSDSECGADQVCAESIVYDCPPSAGESPCPPDAECLPGPELVKPTCTTSTVSYCTPRWQLPCTVAADCGAGFECVAQESCGTSGSSGGTATPGSTPGSGEPQTDAALPSEGERAALPAPPSAPVEPTCEPTGYSACRAIEVACQADSDCLSGWTCQTNPEGVCWSGPDGRGCEPADPAKICVPPYYGSRGGTGVPAEDGGTPTTAGPTPVPEEPQGAPGSAQPPSTPESGEGDFADPIVRRDGGCSMSAAPSTAGGLAWLVFGLASVLGLRRRR